MIEINFQSKLLSKINTGETTKSIKVKYLKVHLVNHIRKGVQFGCVIISFLKQQ